MERFKPGDKVVCVNPNSLLREGEIYTVTGYTKYGNVTLKEEQVGFYPHRFQLSKQHYIQQFKKAYES